MLHRRDLEPVSTLTKQTTHAYTYRDTTALCLQSQLHFHIPITLIRTMCLNDAYFLILTVTAFLILIDATRNLCVNKTNNTCLSYPGTSDTTACASSPNLISHSYCI